MLKPKIFVQPPWESGAEALFSGYGYPMVHSIEEADVVVFNGGEDLHPSMYGEAIIPQANVTWVDQDRDKKELEAYQKCTGKFKFGICRGGQLLNVMNGGRLWQHVDKHGRAHDIIDIKTGKTYWASSVHHQQFILGPDAELVATTNIAEIKYGRLADPKGRPYQWVRTYEDPADPKSEDPEIVFYPNDRALCIQGHPEYSGYGQYTEYCLELIERYYG